MSVPRRHFLLSTGSAILASGTAGCGGARSPYRLLNTGEAATLAALCEQIVPTDETPGAGWANVVKFIDRQLVYHYQDFRVAYRDGLAALDRAARAAHQDSFGRLPFDTQTALVAQMEKGEVPQSDWPAAAQRSFFRMVRDHTMYGYYGDPRHGGNRDFVGWRSLGVPHPPIRGRDDYLFPKRGDAAAPRAVQPEGGRP